MGEIRALTLPDKTAIVIYVIKANDLVNKIRNKKVLTCYFSSDIIMKLPFKAAR